jgi:hypothetical protein
LDRKEAVELGQAMVEQGIIEHVERKSGFKDELVWYRFTDSAATRGDDIKVKKNPRDHAYNIL